MTPKLRQAMRDHFAQFRFATYYGQQTPWVFHHLRTRRRAKAGQRIGYLFRAAVPLAFNIRFHDGNAVIELVSAASTQGESGEFSADRDQTYCLMWEAGAGGSLLEYRVERLRR
jgi:hypothetical protein